MFTWCQVPSVVRERIGPRCAAAGSAAERVQPDLARVEGFLRLLDPARVARCLRGLELRLQLADGVLELAREPRLPGLALRVGCLPVLVLEAAHVVLDGAETVLDATDVATRDLPDLVPATLDVRQGPTGSDPVPLLQERLGLGDEGLLRDEVGGVLLVLHRDLGVPLFEQDVTRGLEPGPEGVVVALAGATGTLPVVEQFPVGGDAVGPTGRQRLGLLDELLLAVAGVAVLRVEFRVERTAVLVDGRARRAEPLPELVRLVLREARAVVLVLLPAGEHVVELRGDLLPLRARRVDGGEGLGLVHQCRAVREGVGERLLGLGGLFLRERAELLRQCGDAVLERPQVADHAGLRHLRAEVLHGAGDVVRRGAALHTLLGDLHLPLEVGVLAREVREGLVRGGVGVLTDRLLGVLVPDVHRPVLVDPAPGRCFVRSHRSRLDRGSASPTSPSARSGRQPIAQEGGRDQRRVRPVDDAPTTGALVGLPDGRTGDRGRDLRLPGPVRARRPDALRGDLRLEVVESAGDLADDRVPAGRPVEGGVPVDDEELGRLRVRRRASGDRQRARRVLPVARHVLERPVLEPGVARAVAVRRAALEEPEALAVGEPVAGGVPVELLADEVDLNARRLRGRRAVEFDPQSDVLVQGERAGPALPLGDVLARHLPRVARRGAGGGRGRRGGGRGRVGVAGGLRTGERQLRPGREGGDEHEHTDPDHVVPPATATLPLVQALTGLVQTETLTRLTVVTRLVLRCHGADRTSRRLCRRA
ncbi:hypothetical protein Cus16_0208 [Curtobacterium sp. ER1/6]|nr:hypothetical protein Cus16_0208 [Curtobacterium sp. ER1/6]